MGFYEDIDIEEKMDNLIYSSNMEDALLKANGPYKIISAGRSFSGLMGSTAILVSKTFTVGEVSTHSTEHIGEAQEESKEEQQKS